MVALVVSSSAGFAGAWVLLSVALCVLPIRAIVDVSEKSKVAFYQADSSKTAWIVVLAIGLIFSPLGLFFSVLLLLWRS